MRPIPEFIGQPGGGNLGGRLVQELGNPRWLRLEGCIAYVKMSGVRQIAGPIYGFAQRGSVDLSVGVDQQGTSLEGVQTLWLLLGGASSSLYLMHNPAGNPSPTFHPKVWLFSGASDALLICGSGNLTGGGLYSNYEAFVCLEMDQSEPVYGSVAGMLASWRDATQPEIVQVTPTVMDTLHKSGELPSEAAIRRVATVVRSARAVVAGVSAGARAATQVFKPAPVAPPPTAPSMPPLPAPPVMPIWPTRIPGAATTSPTATPAPAVIGGAALVPQHDELLIVVNPRNKTEIYLAQAPLKDDPAFFGWPFLGRTTPHRFGNPGQPQPDPLPTAEITVFDASGAVVGYLDDPSLKLWTYSFGSSANDDFRMTLTNGLHALVPDGSIMVMKRQPPSGRDYEITIFPPGHSSHAGLLSACTESLRGGRRYGWR